MERNVMEKKKGQPASVTSMATTTTTVHTVSVTPAILASGRFQTLTASGQQAIGLLPTATVNLAVPRTVSSIQSTTAQPLHVSTTSLSASRLISPQAINIIQRQLSSGIVGISGVTSQGIQVLQASGPPLTLVTASSPEVVAALDQHRKVKLVQQQVKSPTVIAGTGATIHHLGASSSSGQANSAPSNQNQINIVSQKANMSTSSSIQTVGVKRSVPEPGIPVLSGDSLTNTSSTFSAVAGGPSPKKIKLDPKPAPNNEIKNYRQLVCNHKRQRMRKVKSRYREHLTELFYLQGGGNMVEFNSWKKRPSQPLSNFLEGSKLDSDDEEELEEKRINDEVKVLTSAGSNVPLTTPVAISTSLPTSVSALGQQGSSVPLASFPSSHNINPSQGSGGIDGFLRQLTAYVKGTTPSSKDIVVSVKHFSVLPLTASQAVSSKQPSAMNSNASSSLTSVTSSDAHQAFTNRSNDIKANNQSLKTSFISSPQTSKGSKSAVSPIRARQSIASVYETVTGGTQDVIVERAKQEAQVLQRVNELRKEGLWSAKRLPRVQEPPRQKAHWDYLLEEMTWLAADFIQERKWKKAAARKLARMVSNHFKEQEQKELRAEKEEAVKLKKIASQMAKMVKEFWTNIEKVVQYKQTTRMEEKKKKALDLHLSFIVDQTEKYSSWLTAGLQKSDGSRASSMGSDAENSLDGADAEFQPFGTASDDEETIDQEENEAGIDEAATKEEVDALHKESELPIEELLKSLPKEMLENPASDIPVDEDGNISETSSAPQSNKDEDFQADEDDEDEEETIEEQEKKEKKDYSNELDDLKAEGEMSVEDLMKKYAGAYDSDFEMPEESSEEEDSDDESSESVKESEDSSEEEPSEEEMDGTNGETKDQGQGDVGLEFLVGEKQADASSSKQPEPENSEGPGKEFNDIAAAAQSLQPKGYTLETTEVKTPVPFLLKHTLREYQHVGLDWLATMHDKRLNGILADEMGLGKTIQTIALLAHLACDKGTWGPHLIVVPTSVMLNWEMEFKKWCPAFKILTYYGSIKERKLKRQGWTKTNAFHVCITSYKLVVQDHQAFRRKKWKYFILDEAQNIKNFKSQRWQMLLNFSSQRRLLLTGTPLQNSLMELWSLMHFLMPNVFQSHSEFKEWFSNPLTGMIEGSQEYNESLVRRLHGVLRPFLLRRLKNEVEKQMPQKFEHVVMCRLSKRQRYLYDDFMAQAKTKETLAGGHFMSVINILMQLRKVCNHPNLFDPRPIISPFKMEGIVYTTASLATRVFEFDPLQDIDFYSLYPNLAEMDSDLPAFVAQRVKQLKAPGNLIEEVDDLEETPRPPCGQLKNLKDLPSVLPVPSMGISTSPASITTTTTALPAKSASVTKIKTSLSSSVQSTPSSVNSIKLLLPPSSSPSSGATQQTILIPNPNGSGPPLLLPLSGSSVATSSAASAAIASAKLISSQLQSGVLQLVQTSSGHQILTTATSTSSSTGSTAAATTTSTSTATPPTTSSTTNLSLLKLSSVLAQQKPVMRVSPFVVSTSGSTVSSQGSTTPSVISTTAKLSEPVVMKSKPQKPMKKSELFLESLYKKKEERRQHVLQLMSRLNSSRCDVSPVLGSDVHDCVGCLNCLEANNTKTLATPHGSSSGRSHEPLCWRRSQGFVDCKIAQDKSVAHCRPEIFWRETKHLQKIVRSPEDWLEELKDVLARFVFVTPSVISPSVTMRVFHPSHQSQYHWLESKLRPVVIKHSSILHPIQSRTIVTFPELRLIQYDCGKLQTLDLLLRQLKSGQHRVLIFTQMTKMLDVLEAFLNFHGHRYLRLDGTTKVEQRQYLMDRFNADPRIFCFILSTRSGGIGVNLTGADTVIFYDSDWNPTMDAQAQDRCHRIGQTRDVHIYRLISEMTVEENILKKANQKRLLGDLAIEGGNFTTAFFKEQTISDLFAEPSGLESLVEAKDQEEKEKKRKKSTAIEEVRMEVEESDKEDPKKTEKEESKKESAVITQFEQALYKAEDETDAQAAQLVKAEQKAELAEFDENIPWDEREAEMRKEEDEISKVEMELAMLDKELTPIERYAVTVIESHTEPETLEELKMAEEDIENSKKDWELARLKALKEEEERRAELEEDEMLYIYSKDASQVKKKGRKPKNKKPQQAGKGKGGKTPEGSDDEWFDGNHVGKGRVRRASERLSPQKSPPVKTNPKGKKPNKAVKAIVNDGRKKIKAADNLMQKKGKKVAAKGKGEVKEKLAKSSVKKSEVKAQAQKGKPKVVKNSEGTENPVVPSKPLKEKAVKEKKAKAVPKEKLASPIPNGHSPMAAALAGSLSPSKMNTQAKNALLKKQAQQAARIIVGRSPIQSPRPQLIVQSPTTLVNVRSPIIRPPAKPSTPKSPDPPPWSNPNLVIRTRKAAVHSPVVLARPPIQLPPQQQQRVASVLQQSLSRPPLATGAVPVSITSSIAKVQGTPDRNIFQLFTSSGGSSVAGVTLTPTIRQVSPIGSGGQLRGATLINSASLVSGGQLAGARLLAPGLAGQGSVVVSPPAKGNMAGSMSSITLVPTVLNTSVGQQTLLSPGTAGATLLNSGTRATLLNSNRLSSPITLTGLGGVPVAVNLIKTNTGLTLPVRSQQMLQAPQFAQMPGQPGGYVLITPRPRAPTATVVSQANSLSIVQTLPTAGQSVSGPRLVLAQMPPGATIVQQAQPQKSSVNGLGNQPHKHS